MTVCIFVLFVVLCHMNILKTKMVMADHDGKYEDGDFLASV